MYITAADYETLSRSHAVPEGDIDQYIKSAESDIDGMTLGRIRYLGFDALTVIQQEIVKQSIVDQMDFRASYGLMLESPLASYSINGVSMTWDGSKVKQLSGVYTTNEIVAHLVQTGLMNRRVG